MVNSEIFTNSFTPKLLWKFRRVKTTKSNNSNGLRILRSQVRLLPSAPLKISKPEHFLLRLFIWFRSYSGLLALVFAHGKNAAGKICGHPKNSYALFSNDALKAFQSFLALPEKKTIMHDRSAYQT